MATCVGSVKSYAQNRFWSLVEIYYRGRLNRPSATDFPGGWDGMRTGKVWMPFQPPGKPNARDQPSFRLANMITH